MASKTILCQAVLPAGGGHEEAHFVRYAASVLVPFNCHKTALSYSAVSARLASTFPGRSDEKTPPSDGLKKAKAGRR